MKRSATSVIWRTVVFAGAMLGSPACSKKQAQTTPTNPANPTTTTAPAAPQPDPAAAPAADPSAEPTANEDCRVRGCDDDGGGGVGRGFVLS